METQEYQGQMVATVDGGEPRLVRADSITNSLEVISPDHSSIHKGETFIISGMLTGIANAATVAYGFKTPTVASGKIIHLKCPEFSSTAAKVRTDLYEAGTITPTGTDFTAYNKNRIGTPVATTMQAIKVNIADLATNLTGATMMENRQFIPTIVRDTEWVLKPNTWYIRTFTNATGGSCDIGFLEMWIEE